MPNKQSVSYIMARTSYIGWDDNDVHCVLDQHAQLSLFLKYKNSPRVDMSLLSDTSWFWANQSFLFLFNAAYLAEKQQLPILWSLVGPGIKPTI